MRRVAIGRALLRHVRRRDVGGEVERVVVQVVFGAAGGQEGLAGGEERDRVRAIAVEFRLQDGGVST